MDYGGINYQGSSSANSPSRDKNRISTQNDKSKNGVMNTDIKSTEIMNTEINDYDSVLNDKKRDRNDDEGLIESLDNQLAVKKFNSPITPNIRDPGTEISKKQKLAKNQLLQSPNKEEFKLLTPMGNPSVRAGDHTGRTGDFTGRAGDRSVLQYGDGNHTEFLEDLCTTVERYVD
jgi:hypothetical protein